MLVAMVDRAAAGRGRRHLPDGVRHQPDGWCRIIEFATETLTGIPSIIFGLVGMLFFVQKLGLQAGILAGGLTLVMMILPTIIRTTQESLKTVPQSYREGALALGAGKWHMVRTVVLPGCGGRHRHRLYSGHRPHRGRERRPAVYGRLRHGAGDVSVTPCTPPPPP